jgi:hypothetical protein
MSGFDHAGVDREFFSGGLRGQRSANVGQVLRSPGNDSDIRDVALVAAFGAD